MARTVARWASVAATICLVYAIFGAVVWSAYDQFPAQTRLDVVPLVTVAAAPAKIASPRLTVRAFEVDPPLAVELDPPAEAGEETGPPVATALELQDSTDPAPEPTSRPLPERPHSIARAAPATTILAPSETVPHPVPALARAGSRELWDEPPPAADRERAEHQQQEFEPSGEPRSPTASIASVAEDPLPELALPPKPALKPGDVVGAFAAAAAAGSRSAAASGSAAPARRAGPSVPPPQPALKPRDGDYRLASGEPARASDDRRQLDSFWSRVKALFRPASRRVIIVSNGGAREGRAGRSSVAGVNDAQQRGSEAPGSSAGSDVSSGSAARSSDTGGDTAASSGSATGSDGNAAGRGGGTAGSSGSPAGSGGSTAGSGSSSGDAGRTGDDRGDDGGDAGRGGRGDRDGGGHGGSKGQGGGNGGGKGQGGGNDGGKGKGGGNDGGKGNGKGGGKGRGGDD